MIDDEEFHEMLDEAGDVHDAPERRPRTGFLVAGLIVALVAGLIGAALFLVDTGDSAGVVSPTSIVLDTTPTGDFDSVIAELKDFVAQERGLEFLRDVTVELADDAEFEQRLLDDFEDDLDELRKSELVLEALGLMDPGIDLLTALKSLLGQGVVGFYDPKTDELVVRGTDTNPYVRQVLAHELTHALQDQHFELDRPELDEREDEASLGFSALVEGDAVRVDSAYRAAMSDGDRRAAFQEELQLASGFDLSGIPRVLVSLVTFPYSDGPTFVNAVLAGGGQALLDRSFLEPPATSEQILHPDRFTAAENGLPVDPPPADGEVVDEGVLGSYALALLIGEGNATAAARKDVDGWGGDWYVAWSSGDRSCIRATIVGDRPVEFEALASALEAWAAKHATASIVRSKVDDRLTLNSCSAAVTPST